MGEIVFFPVAESADIAWEQYRSLAIRLSCDPGLLTDRRHMEAMARAERDWKRAFLAWDERNGVKPS